MDMDGRMRMEADRAACSCSRLSVVVNYVCDGLRTRLCCSAWQLGHWWC